MKKVFPFLVGLLAFSFSSVAQDTTLVDKEVTKIFTKVEEEAYFPGGFEGWVKYLTRSLNGNVPVTNGAPAATYQVVIRFIVRKDGTISEVTAETNHGFGMEVEAIRVIKSGPKWKPAKQNGRVVNAYRRQPITFVVQEEERKKKKGRRNRE